MAYRSHNPSNEAFLSFHCFIGSRKDGGIERVGRRDVSVEADRQQQFGTTSSLRVSGVAFISRFVYMQYNTVYSTSVHVFRGYYTTFFSKLSELL